MCRKEDYNPKVTIKLSRSKLEKVKPIIDKWLQDDLKMPVKQRHTAVTIAIWFDNLSSVVASIKKNGEQKLTEGFERFAMHYNFEHNFCNPNSGHEKESAETKVGYNRRNYFVPMP